MKQAIKTELLQQKVLELKECIDAFFPAGATTDIHFGGSDVSVCASIWDYEDGKKWNETKRVYLLDIMFVDGRWMHDLSASINDYYRNNGLLLEKEELENA